MPITIAMRAAQSAPQTTYVAKSGTTYTSDTNGLIPSVNSEDVPSLLAMGCQSILYSGLPLRAGSFYGSPPGSTQASVLTVASTLYAYPIFIPNAITLKQLSLSVGTGQTGGKGRGALYYDSNGYPGAIVPGTDTGDLAATSTAIADKTGLSVYLQPGWYWVVTIFAASSTMPSVIGATAVYPNNVNAWVGCAAMADALATSAKAVTGYSKGSSTYPATDMTTSFPTFPAGGAVISNATCPILGLGF